MLRGERESREMMMQSQMQMTTLFVEALKSKD